MDRIASRVNERRAKDEAQQIKLKEQSEKWLVKRIGRNEEKVAKKASKRLEKLTKKRKFEKRLERTLSQDGSYKVTLVDKKYVLKFEEDFAKDSENNISELVMKSRFGKSFVKRMIKEGLDVKIQSILNFTYSLNRKQDPDNKHTLPSDVWERLVGVSPSGTEANVELQIRTIK